MLEDRPIVSPDLALYEVMNTIWKHQIVLKDIRDGKPYLNFLFELVSSRGLLLVRPDEKIVQDAYTLCIEKKCAFYDAVFIVLAKELKAKLQTFDEVQRSIFKGLQ
ncbi:MAG: type II toxin-antitoxin system VapC family toxin [Nitrososphaera sp.]